MNNPQTPTAEPLAGLTGSEAAYADKVKQNAIAWARMSTSEINERLSVQVQVKDLKMTSREARLVRSAMLWILCTNEPSDLPNPPHQPRAGGELAECDGSTS